MLFDRPGSVAQKKPVLSGPLTQNLIHQVGFLISGCLQAAWTLRYVSSLANYLTKQSGHNWTATQCRGKCALEKDLSLSLTLSFPYIYFVILDISSSSPTSHFCLTTLSFNPFTLQAILVFLFLFHIAFTLKVFSPLPQFSGACCLHHAVTSVTKTVTSAIWETEAESLNVKPFDATLWLAPTIDIADKSIRHKWNESTANWVAMKKIFMECY